MLSVYSILIMVRGLHRILAGFQIPYFSSPDVLSKAADIFRVLSSYNAPLVYDIHGR